MNANPIIVHLEPDFRDNFIAGDLVDPTEVDIVDMRGTWDDGFSSYARLLHNMGKEVYAYLQVFTAPLPEWTLEQPYATMGVLATTLPLTSWAYNRPGIDWSQERGGEIARDLNLHSPRHIAGFMLDNWFPDLMPWMYQRGDWLPGWGPLKRKSFAARMRDFESGLSPTGRILNGHATAADQDAATWIMVERAAARKYEAESRVVNGGNEPRVILSIPAEETYNLPWLLELWMAKPGVGLSFTGDDPRGLGGAAAIYAYQRAIDYRKAVE